MHLILSNADAMRFWSTLPHKTFEQSEAWIASMMEPSPRRDDFIVEAEGRVVGKFGAYELPDFGYLLCPSVWRRGYASEAMQAFIAHRRRCGGTELTADTDPRNEASMRLLRKHGFAETGRAEKTWLIGGEWFDSVYWRLAL